MWALNKPETGYLVMGVIGTILAGSLFPVEGVLIANLLNNFYGTDADKIRETGEKWSIGFVALAIMAIVGHTTMSYGFSVAGERLTRRLREIAFKAILRHDVGWFDKDKNSVGTLTTNLEEDSAKVKFATGTNMAHKTHLTVTLLLGILIGLITAWQIGLLAMVLLPLMGIAAVLQMQMMNGTYEKTEGLDGGAKAGVILGGALNGVATVTAFNMQRSTAEQYNEGAGESTSAQWLSLRYPRNKRACWEGFQLETRLDDVQAAIASLVEAPAPPRHHKRGRSKTERRATQGRHDNSASKRDRCSSKEKATRSTRPHTHI